MSATRSWLARADAHWFGPVPAWPLALFRMGIAFVLLCYGADRFAHLGELFGDSPARLPDLAMDAASRWGFLQAFYWEPLSEPAALAAAGVFGVAALALLVGYRARAAAGVLCIWMLLRILFEWHTGFSVDRSSVLVLFVLSLSPCSRVLALDARRRSADSTPWRDARVSAWATRTLQWLFLSWYVLAGLSKLAGSWDLVPNYDVLYSQVQGWYENDLAFWALQHVPKPVFTLLQQMALYFELYAPLLLVPRRLRPIGMLIGIGMHVGVAALMAKLWFFSAEMICFYALFLPLSGGSSYRDAPS